MGSNVCSGFTLSMVVEFPAIVACHVLAVRVGRRLPLVVSLIAGGVSLLLTLALTQGASVHEFQQNSHPLTSPYYRVH